MKIKIFYSEEYNPGEFENAINKFMENKNVINVQYSSTGYKLLQRVKPGSPSGLREIKDHAGIMVVYEEDVQGAILEGIWNNSNLNGAGIFYNLRDDYKPGVKK